MTKQSNLEQLFQAQLDGAGLPAPLHDKMFHPQRRWRFDFQWKYCKVAVEIEGGTWSGGRHVRGSGFEKDCIKYNTATELGWKVFRFTGGMIEDGRALATIKRVLPFGGDGI